MKKIKKKIDAMLIKRKCVSGVTVIEMVLILVGILTTYYGVSIRCIG